MNNEQENFDEALKGADAALHRAALRAKEEAERNGTPYVIAEARPISEKQSSDVNNDAPQVLPSPEPQS